MLNTTHLAAFRAVADAGGVTAGAEQLLVSQPAVSKHLAALERALGTRSSSGGRRGPSSRGAGKCWPTTPGGRSRCWTRPSRPCGTSGA